MSSSSPRAAAPSAGALFLRPVRGRTVGFLALSLLLHVLPLLGRKFLGDPATGAPTLLELKLPAEVSFGVLDGGGEPAQEQSAPPEPPPKKAEQVKQKKDKHPRRRRPRIKQVQNAFAPVVDAGVAEVTPGDADETTAPDGSERDQGDELSGVGVVYGATGQGLGVGAGGHGLGGLGPPGAHIGLHIYAGRINESSLILEVHSLLDLIPGWSELIEDSGLSPLQDFSELFVATPDLRAQNAIVAGHIRGGRARAKSAATRLARRRGKSESFSERAGATVGRWHAARGPARAVALSGSDRMVIAPEADLARVLQVLSALEQQNEKLSDPRAPAVLNTLYKREAIALSVDDLGLFVKSPDPLLPKRARLSVRSLGELHAGLAVLSQYRTVTEAEAARTAAEEHKLALMDYPYVTEHGLSSAVEGARILRHGRYLLVDMKVTMHQTRYVLDLVRSAMTTVR